MEMKALADKVIYTVILVSVFFVLGKTKQNLKIK